MITEKELEEHAITWLQDVGWQYVFGPDLAPDGAAAERRDYRSVLLWPRLRAALEPPAPLSGPTPWAQIRVGTPNCFAI